MFQTSKILSAGRNQPTANSDNEHCGLDIHEGPNLVRGECTPMAEGMVFSNEPMMVVPDEFGVRLEDHFWMSKDGPQWFTEPANSIDNPFGL